MSGPRRAPALSPSLRLVALGALLAACCVVGPGYWPGVALVAAVVGGCAVAARVSLRLLLLRLAPLVSFAVLTGVLLLLAPTPAGTPTLRRPLIGREIPRSGAEFVLSLAAKSVLLVTLSTAFTRWLSERDLLAGLIGLHAPHKVTALLYLMVRSLRDVRDETLRLIRGRDSRGKARGLRAIRVAGAMAQVLLIRLGQRADLRAAALVSRGFKGQILKL